MMLIMFRSRKCNGRYEYEIEPGRWVSRQRIHQLRDRKAHRARLVIISAVKRGAITRGPCEKCGNPDSQCHHISYDDPYAIMWLCKEHHIQLRPKTYLLKQTPLDNVSKKQGRPKGKLLAPSQRLKIARSYYKIDV